MHSVIVVLCSTTYVKYFHRNRNSSCGLHKGEWSSFLRDAYGRLICLRLYANVHRSNFNFIIFIKNNLTVQGMYCGREFGVKNWPRVDSSYGLSCPACYLANSVCRRSLVNGGNFRAKVSGTFVQSRKSKFIREWKFVVRMHFRTDAIEDEVEIEEERRFRQIRFMKWNI